MNLERWEQLKVMVRDDFTVLNEIEKEQVNEHEQLDSIEFEGPIGRIKLNLISKPRILDKKTTYSNRIGSDVKVDYVYSADERVYKLHAYKWSDDGNDWQEMDAGSFI